MSYIGDEETISFVIRRATPVDARQIIAGINDICSEGGAFYTTCFVPTPQWELVLYRPEIALDHMLAVAEWNGKIIGAGRIFPGGRQTLINHVGELGLFVLKSFRQQGIGTQLLTWLIDWSTQENIDKITLSVFATNLPAIRLYQKFSFLEEGVLRNHIKASKQYLDLVLMSKFLIHNLK